MEGDIKQLTVLIQETKALVRKIEGKDGGKGLAEDISVLIDEKITKSRKTLNGAVEILEESNKNLEKNRDFYEENLDNIKLEVQKAVEFQGGKSNKFIQFQLDQYLPKKVFLFIAMSNIIMLISNGIGLFFILKFFKYI